MFKVLIVRLLCLPSISEFRVNCLDLFNIGHNSELRSDVELDISDLYTPLFNIDLLVPTTAGTSSLRVSVV